MHSRAILFRAYGLLTLTSLIWAGNSVAGKIAAGHIDPILLTTLRWSIAALVITALSIKHLKADWPVIKRHWPLLFGYGASGFALFNILLYSALTQTAAVNVMIEQAGIPLIIFLGNFLLFRIKATPAQLTGFVMTFAGVLITASHGDIHHLLHLKLNIGDVMMLGAILVYGGYTISLKWKPMIHWQSLLAIPCIGGALTCVPFIIWRAFTHPFDTPDATGWGVVAYAALFVALLASATYIAGIELIGPNRAGLFINLLPIFGVFLAVLILREPLHGFHLVALALVCGGIVLSEWSRFRPAKAT
ncbi:DMT family transporter [Asticcacaulis taihuensis]|uniref:DMT family transporter n=1 Tax=Asticcacaulis taihuensis TaxID=260084 RepID=UPI0026F23CF2|nr:DMT family transporter [Asticcacaulis taihuensis]